MEHKYPKLVPTNFWILGLVSINWKRSAVNVVVRKKEKKHFVIETDFCFKYIKAWLYSLPMKHVRCCFMRLKKRI